jgi:hypothetical protein
LATIVDDRAEIEDWLPNALQRAMRRSQNQYLTPGGISNGYAVMRADDLSSSVQRQYIRVFPAAPMVA